MPAVDAAVAEALDRALASLDDLRNGGFRSEPAEAHELDHPGRHSGPSGQSSRIPALAPRRRPRRMGRRPMSRLFITYRSGLMWLAVAAFTGLAIGWLASHVS